MVRFGRFFFVFALTTASSMCQVPNWPKWAQKSPATSPAARWGHMMTFDTARGQVVLFGGAGKTSPVLADTWIWDGMNWSQKITADSPAARRLGHLAYDSARGQVILFGGWDGSRALADTWIWDGSDWTQKFPSHSPPARYKGSLADSRRQVVLFGGRDFGQFFSDTWVWEGTDWTQKLPGTSPSARSDIVLAYDSGWQQAILFGGFDGGTFLSDTWSWDGTNWIQTSPSASPPARLDYAMTYDGVRGMLALFGGAATGNYALNDTWAQYGRSEWLQIATYPVPAARMNSAAAYDSVHGETVMFGGWGDPTGGAAYTNLGDTWIWGAVTPPTNCTLACTASGPSVGTVGVDVVFVASDNAQNCFGRPTNHWVFGDGSVATDQYGGGWGFPHTYAAAESFNWTMTASILGATACTQGGTISIRAACAGPSITAQPPNKSISSGQSATLAVSASGTAPLSYQWYQGSLGDTSRPVGRNSANYTTPALTATTLYWVRIANPCGSVSSVQATVTVPTVDENSIVNAASNAAGLVPGSIATLSGGGLVEMAGYALVAGGTTRTSMDGMSVLVDGQAAPLLAIVLVDGLQLVYFQVPYEVAGLSSATLVVNNKGVQTPPIQVEILKAQPGIFKIDRFAGAMTHKVDGRVVTEEYPARPGEDIVLYATGLGAVEPFLPTGSLPPDDSGNSAYRTRATPSVRVGNSSARVLYAGPSSLGLGLYRVQFRLPANPAAVATGNVPVVLTVEGTDSNEAMLPIARSDGVGWVENFDTDTLDVSRWKITNGAAPHSADKDHLGRFQADRVFVRDGYLVLHLTQEDDSVDGLTKVISRGGEVQSLATYGYGTYEWRMRMSSTASTVLGIGECVKGSVSAAFSFLTNSETEIDFESVGDGKDYDGKPYPPHTLLVTNWRNPDPNGEAKSEPGTRTQDASVLPTISSSFHVYKFVWTPGSVQFFVDDWPLLVNGKPAIHATTVPEIPAHIMMNHWGTNNEEFGGMATKNSNGGYADRYFYVDWFRYTPPGEVPKPVKSSSTP